MVAYGVTRIAADGMQQLRNALFAYVTEGAVRQTSLRAFEQLMALDLSFHLNRQTGALSRTVERGSKAVGTVLSMSVLHVVPTAFEVVIVSALLAHQCGPAFSAVTLATIGFYSAFTFGVTQWRTHIRRAQNQAETRASHRFTDSLLNYESVHYFGAAAREAARYDEACRDYQRASLDTQLSLSLLNFGQSLIFSSGVSAALLLSANQVMAGTMTVGDVVMVHGLIFQLTLPLNILGSVYNMVRQATVDMNALTQLLQQKPAVTSVRGAPALSSPTRGRIEFDQVSFGYGGPEGPMLLQDVSFAVEPGQTCAIVGASGSGKSTLLRLLYRFYDVERGAVRIDGQDVRDVSLDSLRDAIGVIPQDVVLFNDSIADNLGYGRPGCSREEVEHAARLACLHEPISRMPSGYETLVGERGLKLSGGEKQRVAIGRALLKEAPVLLCDEATSAVDTVTEAQIFAALRAVTRESAQRQRTCIIIAHRLSTVVDADLIVVLRAGRVAECGTHAALLQQQGEYAQLWAAQRASEY
uniref:ABC transporter n=3 Tax=Emiliania huxleyi TaxID=2903 RepID=A0A6V2XF61_EMIHU